MKLLSPAKLNLFLHITGRRSDGYHELQTLFQLLDYGDDMVFSPRNDGQILLQCPGLDLPVQENLIIRAAELLAKDSQCGLGVEIRVDKRIPAGGGLGGGSSNAATTLLALNHLWQLGYTPEDLALIGLTLGADVPVFVHGHSAWAEGVGEKLQPLELPENWYLVLAPDCTVSTAEVFSRRELTRNTSPIKIAAFFEQGGGNDCEHVVRQLYPEVDNALKWLENFGHANLTGTGGCVFAAFRSEAKARAAYEKLPQGWRGFVARGCNRSPVLEALDG